jgi:hypothetical protein
MHGSAVRSGSVSLLTYLLTPPLIVVTETVVLEPTDQLGDWWLPWHVRTDTGAVVEDPFREAPNLRPLTVREVADDPQHAVLHFKHRDQRYPEWTHTDRIAEKAAAFEASGGRLSGVQALRTPFGNVIVDGAHRMLAFVLSASPGWRLAAQIVALRPPA